LQNRCFPSGSPGACAIAPNALPTGAKHLRDAQPRLTVRRFPVDAHPGLGAA
jgi:hypothetical protein